MVTKLFFEGDDYFHSLHQEILLAKKTIDIEIYIFASDQVGRNLSDLLKQKVREGVRVRLLYDDMGCRDTDQFFLTNLEEAGCEMKAFQPVIQLGPDLTSRNHRKFVLIDQKTAFLGGYNFTNEYSEKFFGKLAWRDTGVMTQDPEALEELQQLFEAAWKGSWREFAVLVMDHWKRTRRRAYRVIPNFGLRRLSFIRQEYVAAMIRARKTIYLTQSYFVPDFGLIRVLRKAARRGLDVRLITAAESDVPFVRWCSQGTYQSLLSAGVKIYEYQDRMMHAKTGVVDDDWWTVGTANMDHLSLFRNLEVNLVSNDQEQSKVLIDQFFTDLKSCHEITFSEWKKRPWSYRLREQFFLLFRHWL
ncbi:MAG: hypothetical protein IPJ69_01120 [Deltaproteobacteria bacterium]|nr:MAG: hypothetical protein IPJ69_01120 [Deltaproteobacteria bacterium]